MQAFKNAQVNCSLTINVTINCHHQLCNRRIEKQQFVRQKRPNVAALTSVDRDPNSHDSDINRRTKLLPSWCGVSQGTMSQDSYVKRPKNLDHLGMCLYFVLQSWTLVAKFDNWHCSYPSQSEYSFQVSDISERPSLYTYTCIRIRKGFILKKRMSQSCISQSNGR